MSEVRLTLSGCHDLRLPIAVARRRGRGTMAAGPLRAAGAPR
ncbi:hypothetical protein [Nocardia sp. alder85J]|nr:hypothetical protein [Nocardia sp. alder85J]MCX4092032.1 hypothetical protein [Nocardia sp. alder85J]